MWLTTLTVPFDVVSIDWSIDGRLLVAGTGLQVWDFRLQVDGIVMKESPRLTFRTELPVPVKRGIWSPDSSVFVTYGEADRNPKVWFRRQRPGPPDVTNTPYDFIYLSHPRGVEYCEWRKPPANPRTVEDNILLTMARDNVCRLWSQASFDTPSHYYMSCLIDVAQTPASLEVESPGMAAIHWMDQREVTSAVDERVKMDEGDSMALRKRRKIMGDDSAKIKRLKDVIRDNPDMLIQIQRDGSVIVWGIQHLNSNPKRVPRVMVIMKIKEALLPKDYEYFRDTPHIFHNTSSMRQSSVFLPSELVFLAHDKNGVINCYLQNLDEFFVIPRDTSHLRLVRSFAGGDSAIKKFVTHPTMNFCATLGVAGDVVVWKVSSPNINVRSSEGLEYLDTFPIKNATIVSWFPEGPFLLVGDADGIAVASCMNDQLTIVARLPDYDGLPLVLLQMYVPPVPKGTPADVDGNVANIKGYIIAVGDAGEAWIWTTQFSHNSVSPPVFVRKCTIGLPKGTSINFAGPTNGVSFAFTPWAPLGAHLFVTYSDDNYLRFWHTRDCTMDVLETTVPFYFRCAAEKKMDNDVDPERVKDVKTSLFGKLAVAYEKLGIGDWISIYDYTATGTSPHEEGEISVMDDGAFHCMDWGFTADGQQLLAVSAGRKIRIHCSQRQEAVGLYFDMRGPRWNEISALDSPKNGTGLALGWLRDGLLAYSDDKQVVTYSKWIMDEALVSKPGETGRSRALTILARASRLNGRVPDHHPHLLIHYMLWGRWENAKYVIALLYRYIKLLSEHNLKIKEIPLPLWKIFGKDADESTVDKQDYGALFAREDGEGGNPDEITAEQAEELNELLTRVRLPNMTKSDQLILMAVIDTVLQVDRQRRSLDTNGARFILFTRLNLYLKKMSPQDPNAELTIPSQDLFWAYHSESQDILIDLCNQLSGEKMLYQQARGFGCFWWIRNLETLKKTVEMVGRNEFKSKEDPDPVGCAPFFMALKKKTLWLGLWKTCSGNSEQPTMVKFLSNDFTMDRWKTAAAKNAFVLMGKQRFTYAVAFFLLAEKPKDAISVCIKNLKDFQMAYLIARCWDGDDGPLTKEVIETAGLTFALEKKDRWLASLVFSMLKQKEKALEALLINPTTIQDTTVGDDGRPGPPLKPLIDIHREDLTDLSDPELLAGYASLKEQYAALRYFPAVAQDVETDFVYQTVNAYERIGMPGLGLKILKGFNDWLPEPDLEAIKHAGEVTAEMVRRASGSGSGLQAPTLSNVARRRGSLSLATGATDWSITSPKSDTVTPVDWTSPLPAHGPSKEVDWSQPVASQSVPQTSVAVDWSTPESKSDAMDWSMSAPRIKVIDDDAPPVPDWAKEENIAALDSGQLDWDGFGGAPKTQVSKPSQPPPVQTQQKPQAPKPPPVKMGEKQAFNFLVERMNSELYKQVLAMRVVQAATNSSATVSDYYEILKKDSTFADYFNLIHDGFIGLCDAVDMPLQVLDKDLRLRCEETDIFRAYIELLPLTGSISRYSETLSEFMVQECNNAARLVFALTNGELPSVYVEFLSSFSRRLLASLNRWHQKLAEEAKQEAMGSFIPQTAITAFVVWSICASRMGDFKVLQNLSVHSLPFFTALKTGDFNGLYAVIQKILDTKEVSVNIPDGSFEDNVWDESVGEMVPKKLEPANKAASDLLMYLDLNQLSGQVGDYLLVLEENGSEQLYSYVRDGLLRPLSKFLYTYQSKLLSYEPISRELATPKDLQHNLRGQEQRKLLALVESGGPQDVVMDTLMHPRPAAGTVAATSRQRDYEVLYKCQDIVSSVSVNSMNENYMAIGTAKGIVELDIEASLFYYEASGKSGVPLKVQTTSPKLSPQVSGVVSADTKHQRAPSFESLQAQLTRSVSVSGRIKPTHQYSAKELQDVDQGIRMKRSVLNVTFLEPHPTLNYYIAAVGEGNKESPAHIILYQFGQPDALTHYASGNARITRCHFDAMGQVFGAADGNGSLAIWRFETGSTALMPYLVLPAHNQTMHDFSFLGSSTFLATGGQSSNGANVCLWDTLLPTSKQRVKSFTCHEGGTFSMVYAPRQKMLITGGKRGDVCVFDVTKRILVYTFQAHNLAIKTLAIDDSDDELISGSTDGDVKAWDLRNFKGKDVWSNIHQTQRIVRAPMSGRSAVSHLFVFLDG